MRLANSTDMARSAQARKCLVGRIGKQTFAHPACAFHRAESRSVDFQVITFVGVYLKKVRMRRAGKTTEARAFAFFHHLKGTAHAHEEHIAIL